MTARDDRSQAADVRELPVRLVEPDPENIRSTDDDPEIGNLADNILRIGLLHPIVVYPLGAGNAYRISSGHRRFLAVQALGWETIPVSIIDTPETAFQRLDLMAAENLQRKQLDPIERALLFKRYIDREMRQKDVAERLNVSQATISSLLPLLDLPAEVQQRIKAREITWQQAVKLGVQNRNEGSARPHGTYGRTRTAGAEVPHFNTVHPLHKQARDICVSSAHPTFKYIGGACGPCWESAIRLDALSDNPSGAVIVPPKVERFANPRDILRLLRCERCGVGALERPNERQCYTRGANDTHRRLLPEHSFAVPIQVDPGQRVPSSEAVAS